VLSSKEANLNVPYMMLQPRLVNRKEYKICILSDPYTGQVMKPYLCEPTHKRGKAFVSPYNYKPVYDFAKLARERYIKSVSNLVYPVLRIDIMRTQLGKLVVNEFESLQATINAGVRGSTQRICIDSRTNHHLEHFWKNEISRIVDNNLNVKRNFTFM